MRDWRRDTSPPVLHPLKGRRHLQCFCRCVRSTNTLALKKLMRARKKLPKTAISLRWTLKLVLTQMNRMISTPHWEKCQREQTDAYGVAANSEATMKHGEFVCVSGDSDGNFGKRVIGHIIDGNIVFTEENIDMDEGMRILFEEESWKTGSIRPPVFYPYQERCLQNAENLLQAVCGSMVTGLHRSFTSVSETWRFTGGDKYGIIN